MNRIACFYINLTINCSMFLDIRRELPILYLNNFIMPMHDLAVCVAKISP